MEKIIEKAMFLCVNNNFHSYAELLLYKGYLKYFDNNFYQFEMYMKHLPTSTNGNLCHELNAAISMAAKETVAIKIINVFLEHEKKKVSMITIILFQKYLCSHKKYLCSTDEF
jgi:hypothetical protein